MKSLILIILLCICGQASASSLSSGSSPVYRTTDSQNNTICSYYSDGTVYCSGGNSALAVDNAGGSLPIFTGLSNGATNFIINSSGNVGINTSSPGSTLEVDGAVTVGANSVSFSSSPVIFTGGGSFAALSSGTTFASFIPDSAITLRRICMTIAVAGVAGSGDSTYCNNSAGNGISVTSSAAAVAGTTTCSVGKANISYQGQVYCHLESGASTKPLFTFLMEHVMQ